MWSNCLTKSSILLQSSLKNSTVQYVRSYRKPRWVPTAPTKVFKIPPRKQMAPENYNELFRLYSNYRTQMRSIRNFLYNERVERKSSLANVHSEKSKLEQDHELEISFAENDLWNKKIAEERSAYLKELAEVHEKRILVSIERKEKRIKEIHDLAEQKIRLEKERCKTFITLETLDEAIENCLKTEVDYNYAIDLNGNIFNGRETKPDDAVSKAMEDF